ncbi:DUF1905 domain-containing protein [Penaeicola halotolerans]|uniref:DUF1905 domain-containing protein n=1 Tax=Penaeicola halotolerans TaxID=2793196 RepID=UPI001CF9171E|nr:DUF1905 domain-containing protein [Penaeicola halotolerans]
MISSNKSNHLIKDEILEIQYISGNGAWTYHLIIPHTKDIKGKWGDIKVSGSIDGYVIDSKNLAPTKNADKILAINGTIRKAIGKTGGDKVTVTLTLDQPTEEALEEDYIRISFEEAQVLDQFEVLSQHEQQSIREQITSLTSEEAQVEKILHYINWLQSKSL